MNSAIIIRPPAPCMLNRITLDRYLDGVKHLPPTPTLMLRLIELFRLPDRTPMRLCN